jgi:hypothetical protein
MRGNAAGQPENPRILQDGMRSAMIRVRPRSDCNRTVHMTASVSMSMFHQWLLVDPTSAHLSCAIILHVPGSKPCEPLIQDISDYLNEYDDDGDGRWLPATRDLVGKVSVDSNHRRLLGMTETAPPQPDDAEFQKTLAALGRRGHVVFQAPDVIGEELKLSNTFHAGIGAAGEIHDDCHLILNPELMDGNCIAHVIGDVFLEWLHCEGHRDQDIRDIR